MGNVKQLKTKQGETILPVTGENGVILTDEQGHQVGLKNYVNGKGINRNTLDPTKVLPGSDKSTIAWLNEQDEKIQQAYIAGVGGQTKATEAYNLATTAKTKAETAERLTDEAAQYAAVADKVRVAMGYAEVGDIATKTYEAGSLLFHNGKLYVLNERWEDGHSWDETIVIETNVALELNKMRGVSTESVVVTISPAEAIPEEGCIVRVKNKSTGEYYDEVTFTREDNTKKVAEVPLNDEYVIYTPELEGYVKMNNPIYKASSVSLYRTINYSKSSANFERVGIQSKVYDSSALPEVNATIKVYDENGGLYMTTQISILEGLHDYAFIPLGYKYSIEFPSIEGYVKPFPKTYIATLSKRFVKVLYINDTNDLCWVLNDGTNIPISENIEEYLKNNLVLGLNTDYSSLKVASGDYNYMIPLSLFTQIAISTGKLCSNNTLYGVLEYLPKIDDASNDPLAYDGENMTSNIAEIAKNAGATSFTTTCIGRTITVNDIVYHGFSPAYQQLVVFINNITLIVDILLSYGVKCLVNSSKADEHFYSLLKSTDGTAIHWIYKQNLDKVTPASISSNYNYVYIFPKI